MNTSDPIIEIILRTVEKVGGIEKMEQAAAALQAVAKRDDKGLSEFFFNLSMKPSGGRQLLANAIAGCVLYAATYWSVKEREADK